MPALWAGLAAVRTFFLTATGLPFGAAGFIAFALGLRLFAAFLPARAGRRPFPPRPFGFGFGCFGILITLFLFLLAAKAFRMLLWGPRWGWGRMGHHGPWRHDWGERGVRC